MYCIYITNYDNSTSTTAWATSKLKTGQWSSASLYHKHIYQ